MDHRPMYQHRVFAGEFTGGIAVIGSSDVVTAGSALLRWNLSDGEIRWSAKSPDFMVRSLAVSPDGATVYYGAKTITCHEGATGKKQRAPSFKGHKALPNHFCVSPDGKHLASGGGSRTYPDDCFVFLFDAATGEVIWKAKAPKPSGASWVAFSPDGSQVHALTGGPTARAGVQIQEPIRVLHFDAASGAAAGETLVHAYESFTPVCGMTALPDGRLVVTAAAQGTSDLFLIGAEVLCHRLPAPGSRVALGAPAASPDGSLLFVGQEPNGERPAVLVVDAATGTVLERLAPGVPFKSDQLAVTPAGHIVACGSALVVWGPA